MMVATEFQAVVFAAGKGSRFPEILEGRPKCLLQVGAYPLIWYPLRMLQKYGFQEVIIIVLENEKLEIQQKIDKTQLKLKIDVCTIPGESDIGTADALRLISEKIKTDVLLVSCDTIVEFSLYPLLKKFREQNASLVTLLVPNASSSLTVPGPKMKYKSEQDLFGVCVDSNRLVFMGSSSDFENVFKINGHFLRQNGKVDMYSGVLDAHVYVIKKWIVDFLSVSSGFSTIKGELLPFIVKKQFSVPNISSMQNETALSEVNVNVKNKDIFQFIKYTPLDEKISQSSVFKQEYSSINNLIECYAVIASDKAFGIRINTLPSFYAANQQIYNIFPNVTGLPITALISRNSVINTSQIATTAVGDHTTIHEKTSIMSSTIGANSVINPKVRISGCIIMDHVVIEENVSLENCIVCEKATVKTGSVLRNSLIGSNYTVASNTKRENAHLSHSEGFMEI